MALLLGSVPLPARPSRLVALCCMPYLVIPEGLHNLGDVEQDGILCGGGGAVMTQEGVRAPGRTGVPGPHPTWTGPAVTPPPGHVLTLNQACPLSPRGAGQPPEVDPADGLTGGKDRRTLTPYCAVSGCGGYMLEK